MAGRSISFFSKKMLVCPICGEKFHKEEFQTGGGRLIAGDLGNDLRRYYQASSKYGTIYPLIYSVTTCPRCFFSTYPMDFESVNSEYVEKLKQAQESRVKLCKELAGEVRFREKRTLKEGLGSYLCSLLCYDLLPIQTVPTFRSAVSSLRAAWTCQDLHAWQPNENYHYLAALFFRKATFYYLQVIEAELTTKEPIGSVNYYGPDIDNNFGYDGVLYLSAYLEFTYGQKKDEQARKRALQHSRTTLARIVGMGKSSKSKPSALLDKARDLHKKLRVELEKVGEVFDEED